MAKRYNTCNANRNLVLDFSDGMSASLQNHLTPSRTNEDQNTQKVNTPITNNPSLTIDYNEINRMIAINLSKLLQNTNLLPNNNQNRNTKLFQNPSQNVNPQPNTHFEYLPRQNTIPQITQGNPSGYNLSPHLLSASQKSQISSDKATSIIQSWGLKFDGSSNGINVEEFLYRNRSLTQDNFKGDFSVILKNLNTLLVGKRLVLAISQADVYIELEGFLPSHSIPVQEF